MQINNLNKYNKNYIDSNIEACKENLLGDEYLKTYTNFDQQEFDFNEPTFESSKGKILWEKPNLQQPRTFSIK